MEANRLERVVSKPSVMSNKKHLLPCIESIQDIQYFLEILVIEGAAFDPLSDFTVYVHQDSHFRLYDNIEAIYRDKLLDKCISLLIRSGHEPFTYLYKLWKQTDKHAPV